MIRYLADSISNIFPIPQSLETNEISHGPTYETQQQESSEVIHGDHDNLESNTIDPSSKVTVDAISITIEKVEGAEPISQTSSSGYDSSASLSADTLVVETEVDIKIQKGARTKGQRLSSLYLGQNESLPFTPVAVSFHNVGYSIRSKSLRETLFPKRKSRKLVPNQKNIIDVEMISKTENGPVGHSENQAFDMKSKDGLKQVLESISGCVQPGEVLAIMGPSGSGKTTFLNVLAGRTRTGKISGQVFFNGRPLNTKMQSRVFGYVMQEDAVQENLTVREAFTYAVELHFGSILGHRQRNQRVKEVINELGLNHCADSIIGGSFRRGISGGEKKRVSIGIELLSQPSVLFLDEPTSGLDSKTAKNLVETLVALASEKRTIVCTIHQPQSSIFSLFDKILLLSHGRIMYFGPADQAIPYFSNLGYECPAFCNPSDFLLDTVSYDTRGTDVALESKNRLNDLALAYTESDLKKQNESNVDKYSLAEEKPFDFSYYLKYGTHSFFRQFGILFRRNIKEIRRNNIATLSRIAQAIVMALFCGLLYFKLGLDQQSIMDRRGALFFIAIQQALCGFLSVIMIFHSEKVVYYREHDSKMYGTGAYYFAKFASELALSILSPVIFVCISYFMMGLQFKVDLFFMAIACLVLSTFSAQALGMVVGTLSPTSDIANVIAPVLMSFMVIFGGLLISVQNVPAYFKWIPAVNLVKYAYEIVSYNEFNGLQFTCRPEEAVRIAVQLPPQCPIQNGTMALKQVDMDNVDIGFSFGVLAALTAVFHVLAYIFLRFELTRR